MYQNKIEEFGGRVQIFGRLLEYKYPTDCLSSKELGGV